jgi:nitrogen fixation protein NifB
MPHPCFDPAARHTSARVHLPVAPRCNLQCRYCNRQTDCLHESRPGVTSGVLTPDQAVEYLHRIVEKVPQTQVVGIAGPGDPLANPDETLETLRLVRAAYPEMLLCLASNGLNLPPYLDDLAALKVSHVTVTVNAIDPEVGRTIYDWMRYGKRTHSGIEAAEYLWEQQKLSLEGLRTRGILPKVNTLLIPGINDHHVERVAEAVAALGAKYHNLIPLYPVAGTPFGVLKEPDATMTAQVRARCGLHLPQMAHCQRCRADAAGLLGHDHPEVAQLLKEAAQPSATLCPPEKCASGCSVASTCGSRKAAPVPAVEAQPLGRRAAVATLEGALVNLHLGQAPFFTIYEEAGDAWRPVDTRPAPAPGAGDDRWLALAHLLSDCSAVFVGGAGDRPSQILGAAGLEVFTVEGLIDELVPAWGRGDRLGGYLRREAHACGTGCRGTGGGCG